MIVEADYDPNNLRPYYVYQNKRVAHFPFNFSFGQLRTASKEKALENGDETKQATMNDIKPYNAWEKSFTPDNVKQIIKSWNSSLPKRCWSNWQLGNHDIPRVATRIGRANVDLANVINLLIGGTAIVYYGEELGMEDLPKDWLDFDKCQDMFGKKYGVRLKFICRFHSIYCINFFF